MSITVEKQGGVTRLQLNRPERRNAFNSKMVVQLHQGIVEALTESNRRCLVISGAGDHFCAGRDLRDVKSESPVDDIIGADDLWADIFRLLDECDLPSVAVVRGYAYAGGFTLTMGGKFAKAGQSLKKKGEK